mmetsp:Transcript_5047/g.10174  ORF Transcript_5047/g.10174 Transcript_5047/m.10174 type:complete len:103 (-) Transcript_5047:1371-1679(-)
MLPNKNKDSKRDDVKHYERAQRRPPKNIPGQNGNLVRIHSNFAEFFEIVKRRNDSGTELEHAFCVGGNVFQSVAHGEQKRNGRSHYQGPEQRRFSDTKCSSN